MKAGKLSQNVYMRSIQKQVHTDETRLLAGPGYGISCSAVQTKGEEVFVFAVEQVDCAGEWKNLEKNTPVELGLLAACNALAAAGASPIGIQLSILFPTEYNEQQLRDLVQQVDRACVAKEILLMHVDTQVTRAVRAPYLTLTAVGRAPHATFVTGTLEPGMDILAVNWVGMEGTVLLAQSKEEELRTRYAQPFLDRAKAFGAYFDIASEAAVAAQSGAGAMYAVAEGGIFAALWEFAERAGVGLEIDLKKIPIRQETVEICEFFDINPYKLCSSGCLLIGTKHTAVTVDALTQAGATVVSIGHATDGKDRVLWNREERRFLERPQPDEITRWM